MVIYESRLSKVLSAFFSFLMVVVSVFFLFLRYFDKRNILGLWLQHHWFSMKVCERAHLP